jgi:hypothetical protein
MGIDAMLDSFTDAEQAAIARYLGQVVERFRMHAQPRATNSAD